MQVTVFSKSLTSLERWFSLAYTVNISPKDQMQADWYHTTIGKYDEWAIEYAYAPFDSKLYISEEIMLDKIASKVSDPLLQYGTDEQKIRRRIRRLFQPSWDRPPLRKFRVERPPTVLD